ncbi:MAG TPA: MFS transporter [Candidatus Atribacteria bacterium]|nr:MFS transporter [Candidatus Atribacteria bacterium]
MRILYSRPKKRSVPNFFIFLSIASASNFIFALTSVLFSIFATDMGFSPPEIGLAISALTAGSLIGGPLWGKLVDKFGKRKIALLVSLSGQALFCLLTPLMKHLLSLVIVRFFFGFFTVAQALILNELTVKIEEEERRSKEISAINVARAAGYSSGCLLSGILGDLHPNFSFYLGSLAVILVFFLTFYLREETEAATPLPQDKNPTEHWFWQKGVVPFYLSIFLRSTAVNGLSYFLPLFWKNMGQTTALIGSVIAISNLAQLLFFPLSGKVSSRSDLMAFRSARFGLLLTIIPFLIAPFFHQGVLILLPQCILSISWAFFYIGTILSLRSFVPPKRQGEALGWLEVAFNLGGIVGPNLFAFSLSSFHNNFLLAFFSLSFLPLVAFFISRKNEKRLLSRN